MNTIKELRKKTGMSQSDLANLVGLSLRTLQEYEQGRRSIEGMAAATMYKITIALRCDIADLIAPDSYKEEVYDNLSSMLADIEMHPGSHDDNLEDYDSELEYYLSNVNRDSYIEYLTDNWVESDEIAYNLQNMVMNAIKERMKDCE